MGGGGGSEGDRQTETERGEERERERERERNFAQRITVAKYIFNASGKSKSFVHESR